MNSPGTLTAALLTAASAAALLITGALALAHQPAAQPWQVSAPVEVPAGRPAGPVDQVSRELERTEPTAQPGQADEPIPRMVASSWVATVATATGIPPVAVAAYGEATLALAAEVPSCHLGWTTLAAIGAVESFHGTYAGAVLLADGTSAPAIVGPALDGVGVAAIASTADSAAWHGDLRWEHAIGPMQFLPATWRRWAADGDSDGIADPHDLDDAALAAGRYLCAAGGDLATVDGWRAAVLAYNHSELYLTDVLGRADGFASAVAASEP